MTMQPCKWMYHYLQGVMQVLILRATDQQFYEFGIDNQGNFFFRRHDPDGQEEEVLPISSLRQRVMLFFLVNEKIRYL